LHTCFKIDSDQLHDECGVFGIYNNDNLDTATLPYFALHALQHRGQESAGLAASNGRAVTHYKGPGYVTDVFSPELLARFRKQRIVIGHVRYSTSGSKLPTNAQPIVARYSNGFISVAHNGSLINSRQLSSYLTKKGALLQTDLDSELIIHLISNNMSLGIDKALEISMDKLKGAYAVVMMTKNELIGIRDPHGIRPLCIGKIGDSYVLASESCAFDAINAEFVRDAKPGEIIIIDENGLRSFISGPDRPSHLCMFEFVYFARTDSIMDRVSVYKARVEAGALLAQTDPVDADMVAGVPDSAIPAALGYSQKSGIPYGEALVKNRYIGRTFIEPTQSKRKTSVKMKLAALKANVEGKRIVLIDDSIVRGTTSARIVDMLRGAGATEVHLRISSPPVKHPCFYGIDTPDKKQLINFEHSASEICQMVGADSLAYLPINKLEQSLSGCCLGFCDACFSGNYPVR
jgi:amidophosphoribosyltransferase